MLGWQPFVFLNATLIICLSAVLWVKFHRLRLSIERQFSRMQDASPPILIGEAFLGERFERLEKQMMDVRVRLDEIEHILERNGYPHAGGSG